ncbi:triggering receptor expressed on myeloid cells 3-like [Cynocephalus volans]|uniref:triggering receptor expressed on myeloid cells 3-like n=1 Tax=Cynocephalus volans TaxID=110931 RepID=UPI002FC67677
MALEWLRLLLLLLLLLGVSGFQAVGEREESMCLLEGNNLTMVCPYNVVKYSTSLKAWQRVGSQGPPETLVSTKTTKSNLTWAQAGRYLLEDFPTEAIIRVTVTELQRRDLGMYQCVILLASQDPIVLNSRIRPVQCKGPERPLWIQPSPCVHGPSIISRGKSSLPLCFGLAAPRLLVSVLCGLLVANGLMLSVLYGLQLTPLPPSPHIIIWNPGCIGWFAVPFSISQSTL